jgi:hypothetical protein
MACGEAAEALDTFDPPVGFGFVVKSAKGHSAGGVWVFGSGFGGLQLMRATHLTKDNLMASALKSRVFIEEFLPSEIPGERKIEYKVFAFNGIVGAVTITVDRGTAQ